MLLVRKALIGPWVTCTRTLVGAVPGTWYGSKYTTEALLSCVVYRKGKDHISCVARAPRRHQFGVAASLEDLNRLVIYSTVIILNI